MYLLASLPATSAAAQSGGLVQKIFSEQTLRAWGAPAGHMFQPGFPLSARVVNLAYKASLPGTAICMEPIQLHTDLPIQTCSRTWQKPFWQARLRSGHGWGIPLLAAASG